MVMRNLRILLLVLAALGLAGLAAAQAEPTIQQIYAAAQSGQVDKAREMTQEVLRTHPKSAKAHFVIAELDATQGRLAQAREALATAESLAPGLPFAKPEAVQALRGRLSAPTALPTPRDLGTPTAGLTTDAAPTSSIPWGMVLLAGVVIAIVAWRFRPRPLAPRAVAPDASPAGYGPIPGSGWGAQPQAPGPQPGYGQQPAYGQQPPQPGMGGRLMGGLATGLAVGAGAVAAQEIGRRMFSDRDHPQQGFGASPDQHGGSAGANSQLANDAGLGSLGAGGGSPLPEDFGIADGGSWDDGGSSDGGGGDGGSWDS